MSAQFDEIIAITVTTERAEKQIQQFAANMSRELRALADAGKIDPELFQKAVDTGAEAIEVSARRVQANAKRRLQELIEWQTEGIDKIAAYEAEQEARRIRQRLIDDEKIKQSLFKNIEETNRNGEQLDKQLAKRREQEARDEAKRLQQAQRQFAQDARKNQQLARQEQREFDKELKASLKAEEATRKENARIVKAMNEDALRNEARISKELERQARMSELIKTRIAKLGQSSVASGASSSSASGGLLSGIAKRTTFGDSLYGAASLAGMGGHFEARAGLLGLERVAAMAGVAGSSISSLGPIVMGIGAIAAAAALPLHAMFGAKDFVASLHDVATLLDNVKVGTSEFKSAIDSLAVSAVNLSTKFNMETSEVLKAFKTALSSGIGQQDVERFTNTAATLSKALNIPVDEAITLLTSLKDAYHLNIDELGATSSVLFNTIKVGIITGDQLVNNFGRLIPVASSAGVSLEDAAAAVAVLTRQGVTASQSVTAITNMIQKIVKPTDKAKEQFYNIGMAYGEAALKGRSLISVMEELKNKTGGSLEKVSELFPEERARRGVLGSINNIPLGRQTERDVRETGSDINAAAIQMDTFTQKVGQVNKAISGTWDLIGKDLLDAANKIFFGDGPMGPDTLAKIRLAFEHIGLAVKFVGIILMGLVKEITNAISVLYKLVEGVVKAAWAAIHGNWSEAWDNIKEMGNTVLEGYNSTLSNVKTTFNALVDTSKASTARIHEIREGQHKEEIDNLAEIVKKDKEAAISRIENYEAMAAKAKEAAESVTSKVAKKKTKIRDEKFDARASEVEKKDTINIEESLVNYEDTIIKKKAEIAAEMLQYARDLSNEYGDKVFSSDIGKATLDNHQKLLNEILRPFEERVKTIKSQLEARKDAIAARPDTRVEDNKKAEEQRKIEAEEKRRGAEVQRVAEALYKKDYENYQKWLDKKKKALEDINKKMEEETKRHDDVIADLNAKILDARMSGEQDPRRRKAMAQQALQAAREELQSILKHGGSVDSYNKAREQFSSAANSVNENTEDKKRGANGLTTALEELKGFEERFHAAIEKAVEKEKNTVENTKGRLPDAEAAAKRAIAQVEQKITEKREVQVELKISADGTFGDEAIETLKQEVIDAIEKDVANGKGRPKFPRTSFKSGGRSVVSDGEDDE